MGEKTPLLEDQDQENEPDQDYVNDNLFPDRQETSFTNDGFIGDTSVEDTFNTSDQTVKSTISIKPKLEISPDDTTLERGQNIFSNNPNTENFYRYFKLAGRKDVPSLPSYEKFEYRKGEGLFYKSEDKYGEVLLTAKSNPKTLVGLNTIIKNAKDAGYEIVKGKDGKRVRSIMSAQDFVKYKLGFEDYGKTVQKAQTKLKSIQPETIPMEALPKTADQVSEIIEDLTNDVDVQTEGLNYRELAALDKTLQTVNGELILNQARLDELDVEIQQTKDELEEATSERGRKDIQEELDNLRVERRGRLEVINRNTDRLRSQINRIKETITAVMDSDLTLRERINILFKEQGITIVSILTAIGLAVSTIVSSIVASVRAVGTPSVTPEPAPKPTPAPPSKGGVTDWIKRQLWNLANVLKKLGLKALGALPGIIGSILSWIFNVASKAAGWVAEHVWTLFVGAGVLLLTYVQKG